MYIGILISFIIFLGAWEGRVFYQREYASGNYKKYNEDRIDSSTFGYRGIHPEPVLDKENVTKLLIRTCKVLKIQGQAQGCSGYSDPSIVWGFIRNGSPSLRGSISNAWSGSTSSSFSCANMDRYGRYLIQKAFPSAIIASLGYQYDLTNIGTTGRTDPCGYSEILDR